MESNDRLSHVAADGSPRMVNVAGKSVTHRRAAAEAYVHVGPALAQRLREPGSLAKGDALQTARLAGIMAAKRTAELIPLCHPIALELVQVDLTVADDRVHVRTRVESHARTGVEMEAMTAAAVAALTVYDMVKSVARGTEIGPVRLLSKEGGKSGPWRRAEDPGRA